MYQVNVEVPPMAVNGGIQVGVVAADGITYVTTATIAIQ